MVRVVVIGHGLIGRDRAAALMALSQTEACTLSATVDPVPRPPEMYGGHVPHYGQLEQLPRDAYDAAIIAVPHHLAASTALGILGQGKPVLVEKPLGLDAAEARTIAAAGAGTASFVGYNYRFLPTFREAVQRLRAGELGALRSVDMFLGHGGNPRSAEGWKLRPELAGGGVILDPGVHLLDLALCLDPTLEPRHVSVSRGFWKTGIEEDAVMVLTAGALMVTVRVSHIRWVNTFRIEIGGEDGYVHIEGRGGAYGPQRTRYGRRWGWNDGTGRNQRETEVVNDYGPGNQSLADELQVVVRRWSGSSASAANPPAEGPGPATLAEGVRIAELCDRLYATISADASGTREKR